MLCDWLRTVRASSCINRNLTEALRALFGGGVEWFLPVHARYQYVHRFYDKEEYCGSNQYERDQAVDEVAVHEDAVVDRKGKVGEVGCLGNGSDEWCEEVRHQCGDDRTECRADYHANRQVNDVSAQEKLLEFFYHCTIVSKIFK